MILETAIMCLALNIYYEARSEPHYGQIAVALVTLNRAEHDWRNVCEAVYEPGQFSWTQDGAQGAPDDLPALREAALKARVLITWTPEDMEASFGRWATATHFHADYISPPDWTQGMERIGQVGRHIFYRENP